MADLPEVKNSLYGLYSFTPADYGKPVEVPEFEYYNKKYKDLMFDETLVYTTRT